MRRLAVNPEPLHVVPQRWNPNHHFMRCAFEDGHGRCRTESSDTMAWQTWYCAKHQGGQPG